MPDEKAETHDADPKDATTDGGSLRADAETEKAHDEEQASADDLTAAMDEQVAAAAEDPSLVVVGDPNDGGFKQEPGHGWSEEEQALRAWTGNGPRPDGVAATVGMTTGVAATHEGVDITDEEIDYEALTVVELKELAKENDIDLAGATKKDDIIDAIKASV